MSDAALDAQEEALWRALLRLMISLPRVLDDDLVRASGLSLTAYAVLMYLSEAPYGRMRMSELATATALSASRISRMVDDLQARNLVIKRRSADDGRGAVAVLTEDGLRALGAAYPHHLRSARRRLVDRLTPDLLPGLAAQLAEIVNALSRP